MRSWTFRATTVIAPKVQHKGGLNDSEVVRGARYAVGIFNSSYSPPADSNGEDTQPVRVLATFLLCLANPTADGARLQRGLIQGLEILPITVAQSPEPFAYWPYSQTCDPSNEVAE
jgi:hypothetical protein